jgi:hypothetical protein
MGVLTKQIRDHNPYHGTYGVDTVDTRFRGPYKFRVSTATISESGFRVKHSFYTDEEKIEFPNRWHCNRKDEDFVLNSLPAPRFLVAQIITSGKSSAIGTVNSATIW